MFGGLLNAGLANATGDSVVVQLCIHGSIKDKGNSSSSSLPSPLSRPSELCLHSLRQIIDRAFTLDNVAAVVLSINSSSGSPAQCSVLSQYLRHMADNTNVPLIAMVEDAAICGGYWLATTADIIFADQNAMLGSIGSISLNCNMHDLLAKFDVESRILATHPNKIGPNPLAPLDKDFQNQERIQMENMKVVHKNFVRWVRSRRGTKLKESNGDIFDGRVFVGENAARKGLVDFIGGKEEIDQWLKRHTEARGTPRWVSIERADAPAGFLNNLIPTMAKTMVNWLLPGSYV